MSLPPPTSPPDPTLARIILDVDALSDELGHVRNYFSNKDIDYGPIAAALMPNAAAAGARVHQRLVMGLTHRLSNEDYLTAHTAAALSRGIAYGLELARRRSTQ